MLRRIHALVRRYHPLPPSPPPSPPPCPAVDYPAPAIPACGGDGEVQKYADAFARSLAAIENQAGKDPILHRLNVADCLRTVLDALPHCRSSRDGQLEKEVGRVVESPRLLEAVIAAGRSAAEEYVELAEDIQQGYLVALAVAVSHHCLSSDRALDLLLGQAGVACGDPATATPSYAHYLHSRPEVSMQNAFLFAKVTALMIHENDLHGGDARQNVDVRRNLLMQKGYGPRGRTDFYSAIALGAPSTAHQCLLGMLRKFDLLPSSVQLALKEGGRGGELAEVLRAVRPFPHEQRSIAGEPLDWMLGSAQMVLCPDRLEGFHTQHQRRLALATALATHPGVRLPVDGLQ
jgi:hypothetical protein